MRYFWPVKAATKLVWYSKHELVHVLLGLVYAWFLRETWGEFSPRQIYWSVFGSLLPDLDHLIYFFFYGRKESYSLQVKKFLREGRLSNLFRFLSIEHKHNTHLWSHNVYVVSMLFLGALFSFQVDWKFGVIVFGSMVLHFLFDIVDDFLVLGALNSNWRRWGRGEHDRVNNRE